MTNTTHRCNPRFSQVNQAPNENDDALYEQLRYQKLCLGWYVEVGVVLFLREKKCCSYLSFLYICWLLCLLCLSPCLCLACDERWWRRRAVIAGNLVHYQLIIKPGQMSRCCPVATSVPPCSTSTQTLLDLSKIRHTALIYLTTWICWNICNDGEVSMTGVSKILTI